MAIALFLILIPIFIISISIYILINVRLLLFGTINVFIFSMVLFLSIVLAVLLSRLVSKIFYDSKLFLNFNREIYLFDNVFSIFLMLIFGICLLISNIVNKLNIFLLILSILVLSFSCVFLIKIIHDFKNRRLKLVDISNTDYKKIFYLVFKDENDTDYGYYITNKEKDKYLVNRHYIVKFNYYNNEIHKIKGLDGDINENE